MNCAQAEADLLFLGIDGGGSKCKAVLADAKGLQLGMGIAGPANPFQNLELACESIVQASQKALADAGLEAAPLNQLIAGVGLAGVNIPHTMSQMRRWQHPFAAMYLTTDIHIACLGAHGGEDGAVIVAGTGSVGYVCTRGRSHSYGAHGFPFGDKGSGAWLGLEALKAALLYLDELGPATQLLPAIQQQLGVQGLDIVARMAGARPSDYGALAPLVLQCAERGDAVAEAIVRDAAAYLDQLAAKLMDQGAGQFALLGGLAPGIAPWLSAETQNTLVTARGQPDQGALQFAQAQYSAAAVALV